MERRKWTLEMGRRSGIKKSEGRVLEAEKQLLHFYSRRDNNVRGVVPEHTHTRRQTAHVKESGFFVVVVFSSRISLFRDSAG